MSQRSTYRLLDIVLNSATADTGNSDGYFKRTLHGVNTQENELGIIIHINRRLCHRPHSFLRLSTPRELKVRVHIRNQAVAKERFDNCEITVQNCSHRQTMLPEDLTRISTQSGY